MNTLGTNSPRLVIGDADGLIALLFDDDVNHSLALQAAQKLVAQQADVLFPLTAIVEATTTIQQYEITLNFNGPASKLTLAYRSDPPLPTDDIITLLALGQTTAESAASRGAGASPSGTAGASAILSEAVSSQLGGRLERLFGITRFRVDPGLAEVGSTGSEQNAAARVTVEQQIARNLTITYVSNVSSTQEQVIQVEYNVDRNVSIVGLRDQNGTFGIDIKIKKRF